MLTKEQLTNSKKYIKALRSGKYEQTRSELKREDNCFCALGLALEVFRQETGKGTWVNDDLHRFSLDGVRSAFIATDYPQVREFFGFEDIGVGWKHGDADLLELNGYVSFPVLAEMLETELNIW